jgi:processive 1,2-diacylglycerol beta-glucosyltransferase
VLPGRNEELRWELETAFSQDGRVRAEPFTTQVPLYMDACDVLLSKPGGISSTEAAVKNVPLVHTAPIPGCETLNAEFFSQRGMSILAPNEEQAARNAVRLAFDEDQKRRMLEAQRQYIRPDAADTICDYMVKEVTNHETSAGRG